MSDFITYDLRQAPSISASDGAPDVFGSMKSENVWQLDPDLPAFDGLPMIDRAFCAALRVARTLGDNYATEGMDLEEVGLAHTIENLLYTIPQKCEAALGEHPTDVASFERWSNLDMIDRLWWMLREEKTKVRSLVCISICDILKTPLVWRPW